MHAKCSRSLLSKLSALPSICKYCNHSVISPKSTKDYPAVPNVGIGIVILRKLQGIPQVLLVRRAKEPQKGLLTFPGGSLELGETMVACAIRETLEETGLALRNTLQGSFLRGTPPPLRSLNSPQPIDAVDSIHYDESGRIQYHYTIVDLAALPSDPTAEPEAADDVDEVFWTSVRDLKGLKDLGNHCARIAENAAERFDIP